MIDSRRTKCFSSRRIQKTTMPLESASAEKGKSPLRPGTSFCVRSGSQQISGNRDWQPFPKSEHSELTRSWSCSSYSLVWRAKRNETHSNDGRACFITFKTTAIVIIFSTSFITTRKTGRRARQTRDGRLGRRSKKLMRERAQSGPDEIECCDDI